MCFYCIVQNAVLDPMHTALLHPDKRNHNFNGKKFGDYWIITIGILVPILSYLVDAVFYVSKRHFCRQYHP